MSTRPHLSEWESTWAFVTGGGLLLIIMAFGLSAMRGADNNGALNGVLLIGVLLLAGGTAGWLVQFRPWRNFDDQSTPLYTGHEDHGSDGHDTSAHVAEVHGEDQPGETHVTEPDSAHKDAAAEKVDIDAHLPQIFHEAKTMYSTPAESHTEIHSETLPPPPVIVDPMTAFPPAIPAAPTPPPHTREEPPPVTHVEPDVPEPAPLDQPVKHDNLQLLEGIGPKIAATLAAAGIFTFADLARRPPEELEKIVRNAGVRMVGRTDTWVKQAEMAARGDMTALREYQSKLRSGPQQS